MSDNDKTVGFQEARGKQRLSMHLNAISDKDGDSGLTPWIAPVVGGSALVSLGVLALLFIDKLPWYIGAAVAVAGLQVGTRGLFGKYLLVFKDGAVDLLKAKKDAA